MSKRTSDQTSAPKNDKAAVFDPADFPPGDNAPFEAVYRLNYKPFIAWGTKRWGISEDALQEAFNEAILIFRRKAWEGDLKTYSGKQVNTILFSFAANLVRNRIKTDQKHASRFEQLEDRHAQVEQESAFVVERERQRGIFSEPAEGRVAELRKYWKQLTERCQKILNLRIVQGMSMPDIAEALGLSNANSAKTAKNKCLNRLKTLMGR